MSFHSSNCGVFYDYACDCGAQATVNRKAELEAEITLLKARCEEHSRYANRALLENATLREQLDQQIVANAALTGENSELFCKLAAAQKDAERIDSIYFEIFQDQPNEGLYGVSIGAGWSVGETFREAIDAAIEGSENNED